MPKATWMIGTAMLAMATVPATAQTSPEPAGQAGAEQQTETAFDDIVVTARRRDERGQDVPVAITGLSAEALQERFIQRSDDLQFSVPALRIAPQISAVTPNFIIRGQSRPLFSGALPGVVTYFNDVPLPQDGSIVPLYDLSSVQVLKGPQGTLFGRNTIGGAVLLTAARPRLGDVEGFVEASAGSYDAFNLTGAINVPIVTDRVALRIAGDLARRDGFIRNLSGRDALGNRHTDSVRGSLLIKPTDTFENLLVVDYTRIDESGAPVVPTAVFFTPAGAPAGTGASAANAPYFFGGTLATDIRLQLAQLRAAGTLVANPGIDTFTRGHVFGIANTTTLDLGGVTVKNIFGYRRAKIFDRIDVDGLPAALNDRINGGGAFPQVALDSISDEFQVLGTAFDDRLDYVAGAFYLNEGPTGVSGTQALQFFRTGSPAPIVQNIYIRNRSKALFAQATYHFGGVLDGLNLTAGYRHTWDRRSFCVLQQTASLGPDNCGGATRETKYDAPSYTLTADYKITPDVLVYVSHRRGFRGGGVNTNVPVGLITGEYRPETVKDFEGGLKSSWRLGGMTGRFNVAYYRANISDLQTSAVAALPLPGGGTLNSSIVANAAKSHTEGYEIEFVVNPVEGLTLAANYDRFSGKFDEFTGPAGFPVGSLLDYKFNAPPRTLNLNGRYDFDLPGNLGRFGFGVNYFWRDDTLISTAPSVPVPETVQPAFDVIDLRADWRKVGGSRVDLAVFVRNLGDTRYRTGMSNSAAVFSLATSYYGDPRTYGAQVRFEF